MAQIVNVILSNEDRERLLAIASDRSRPLKHVHGMCASPTRAQGGFLVTSWSIGDGVVAVRASRSQRFARPVANPQSMFSGVPVFSRRAAFGFEASGACS